MPISTSVKAIRAPRSSSTAVGTCYSSSGRSAETLYLLKVTEGNGYPRLLLDHVEILQSDRSDLTEVAISPSTKGKHGV